MKYFSFLILSLCIFSCTTPLSPQENSALSQTESKTKEEKMPLTREILNESLQLGSNFLLENQKPEGNFEYEYNFKTKEYIEDDNQVRQAGALWGVSLLHAENPSEETEEALKKGLAFFRNHSQETNFGGRFIVYPGDSQGSTGTIALVSLALIEWLKSDESIENRAQYEADLSEYLSFLRSLRMENGQFFSRFQHKNGSGVGNPSPYFDGEALLALTKAAKYMNDSERIPDIMDSAEAMYTQNVTLALQKDKDSNTTKGFYQWGSMAFYEIFTAKWEGSEPYAKRTIEMAYWMIDTHKILQKTRNTAYAYEGIISAYELAYLTKDTKAQEYFQNVIETGLQKLTSWQVGNSLENSYLKANVDTTDQKAIGGIMNSKDEPTLRIDVTQHQMHAVLLAREFLWRIPIFSSE